MGRKAKEVPLVTAARKLSQIFRIEETGILFFPLCLCPKAHISFCNQWTDLRHPPRPAESKVDPVELCCPTFGINEADSESMGSGDPWEDCPSACPHPPTPAGSHHLGLMPEKPE